MAGASSSSGGRFKYDVFINFRGEDTRRCFVCHLYEALKQKALDTFIDSEDLRKGDDLSELFKAIQDSRLSIVVFSKDYASSKWCLKELVQILECMDGQSQIVVPIFYEVDPSHIRNLEESFAEAFAKHESNSKIDKEELESWKSSLTRATSLSGWDSKSKDYRDDTQLIGSIVEDILKKLIHSSPSKTDGLIGMDSHMDKIDSLLQLGVDDFRIVGIWGMGGIGKSTIARAVFDKIAHQYEHNCFLENVKEGFITKNGAVQMVEKLLSKILKVKDRSTLDGGLNMIRERLGKKKILLVLDDVDNLHQIETLIGEKPIFGGGSRIIITTRDKKLLAEFLIYEPKLFTNAEALELFSKSAFKRNKPLESYDAISRRAVKYAYGLPLALKVLGALLVNRTVREWEYELEKINEISITSLDKNIRCVLRASYDGLHESQQKIFLDIACFFKEKDKGFVTKFHESCRFFPETGLKVLVERSLVTVSHYGTLQMHDLIQELGRDIVYQQSTEDLGMRSRLWDYKDVLQVLAQNTATNVEGIILDLSKSKEVYVNDEVFVSMRRLRLLQLFEYYYGDKYSLYGSAPPRKNDYEPCVQVMRENLKFLSNELRVLVWHGCPLKSFPINFQPKNLIYVDMCYSRIEQFWEGTKPLQNLVYLDLSCSKYLIKTPDFTEATNLEKLNLEGCTSLLEVHPSISALKSLVELDLRGCTNLKKFPNISGNMKELRELYLDETAITEIPSSINDLSRLQTLSLIGCRELRSLPSSIHMKSLAWLDLFGCSKLTEFPEILEVMEELVTLGLDGTAIKELPSSINNLTGLRELSLTNCTSLVCLPDNICNLASLYELNLTGCSSLVCLPDNICNLASLYELNLTGCSSLVCLPDNICNLASLSHLNLTGCSSLVCLPDNICNLASLSHLNLTGCSSLVCLPDNICNLASLSHLNLTGCSSLVCLPDNICNLASLYELNLTGCSSLVCLPDNICNLARLYELNLTGCSSLVCLPDNICNLARLYELNLTGCSSLVCLPDNICNLASLSHLNLTGCSSLVCLPDNICNLACLYELNLTGCSSLVCLPDNICNLASYDNLARLYELNLTGCSSLVCLPDNICNLARLSHLNLTGCSSLVCLPDNICNLARLSHLNLTGCSSLVCLPDNICNLARLSHLNLTECSNLSKLPEYLGNLKSLWQFEVGRSGIKQLTFSILRLGDSLSCNGCKEMTAPFSSWPTWNPQNQRNSFLESLDLSDCNLLELSYGIAHLLSHGIAHLSLYELNLSGNNKLESLPAAMIRLGHLRRLYLRGCKRLKSIPELSSSIQEIDAQDCTSLETVSTPQPPYAEDIRFRFVNCFKLVTNTNLFIDIVETATDIQAIYDRYIGPPYHVSLPGSDIPEWFNHQSRGSSVTVQLPPNWLLNKFLGFAICAIGNLRGAANTKTQSAVCCCTLEANDGQDNFYFSLFDILDGTGMPLESDHMLLGYTNLRSLGERHNERKYTEARFRIVASTYGVIPNDSMTLEDCTWITSCGVRLFHINPPSVDLICNLENRETEIRSKRKRETLERGKEKMGVEVQEEGEECSGGPICCCFSLSGCTLSLRKRQKEKEREGEGVAGDTGLESEDADVSGEGGLLTLSL